MNVRIILLLALTILFCQQSVAQRVSPQHYLIKFIDKKNSPFSVKNPEKFLSQRAIERRLRYNIPVIENDLPVNETYIEALKKIGFQVINKSKWLNSVTVFTEDSMLLEKAKKLPYVVIDDKFVHANETKIVKNEVKETIAKKDRKKAVSVFDYGKAANQIKMLNGHILHNMGYRGQGIQIALLDAGYYHVNSLPAFDSIRANNQILGKRDFVDLDTSVYDADTHGMMVLSTIAANQPEKFIGTAPKAGFYLLRSEQARNEYIIEEHNWAVAAEYADSLGADMINSSLGYQDFDDTITSHRFVDMNGKTAMSSIAANTASSKGMLVVVSAGNDGDNAWGRISSPADADGILTIGAVDREGELAYFSSVGPSFDGRIKPDVVAMGLYSTVEGSGGEVSSASGTSFSGPILAGMAACLWQAHPKMTNLQIIDAIRKTASQYDNPDNKYGYGIPDFYAAHLYLKTKDINYNDNKNLRVFPNPFRDNFNILLTAENTLPVKMTVELFDLFGKKIYSNTLKDRDNHQTAFLFDETQNLATGVYVLKLTTADNTYRQMVVKE